MSDLTDSLILQLLLFWVSTACSDLTFVRCLLLKHFSVCLATSQAFIHVRATEQLGAEVHLLFLTSVSLQQSCTLMRWEYH